MSDIIRLTDSQKTAVVEANELKSIWAHLGEYELTEQVEAHLESAGYSQQDIDIAMEEIGLSNRGEYAFVVRPAA